VYYLVEYKPGKRVMVISLGDKYSILAYSNFSIAGFILSILKKGIEVLIMIRFRMRMF